MMDGIINILYRLRFYRAAYWLAAKYMPPHHPLNFQDEP